MSYKRETKLKDLGKIEKVLAKNLSTAMIKAMRLAGTQSIPVLRARTLDAPPASANGKVGANDTGKLLKGWEIDFSQKEATVTVYNTQLHAAPAEEGVKASSGKIGAVGRDQIQGWMMRKGIKISNPNGNGFLSDKAAARFLTIAINRRKHMRFLKRKIVARAMNRIKGIFMARIMEARLRLAEQAMKR